MKIVKILFQNTATSALTLFFALFSLGQLQRIQLANDFAFYLHDLVVIFFVIRQILTDKKIQGHLKNIPELLKKIKLHYFLELIFVVWIFAGMGAGIAAGRITLKGLLYLARLLIYIVFTVIIRKNKQLSYPPKRGLAIAGALIAFWGLLQYVLLPDTRFLHLFGWDNHYYRLISTLFDPAFTGMILVLTFGLWGHQRVFPKLPANLKKMIQLLLTVAVAATFSRASYLALFALTDLQLITKKIKFGFAALLLITFITSLWLLPKPGGEGVNLARTSTGEARLTNSQQGLSELKSMQWIWGRGLFNNDVSQTYETPSHAQLPDSLPILLLNSIGIGGTLLALALLAKWSKIWWKKDPVWTSLLFVVLIHSLFNNTFLQPFVFLALWIIF